MNDKKIFLPYKAITASGKEVNFKFSLDENTNSPLVINEIINLLLSKISNEINIYKPSNGDIIQALCMALVVRCRIIDYDINKIEKISGKIVDGRKSSFPGEVISDFLQKNKNYFK